MKVLVSPKRRAHNFIDLRGKVFGRLTVTSFAGSELVNKSKPKYKSAWNVLCTCGNTKIVRGADLSNGRVKSCGCLSSELTTEFNKRTKTKIAYDTFSCVWQSYRRGARKRNLEFNLTKDEFYELTQKNCHYCGVEPKQIRKARVAGKLSSFVFNGVDRINSDIGYHPDNCVPCCKTCNYMKSTATLEEFLAHIKKILNYLKR